MSFKNAVVTATAGGSDVTLYTCPAGAEASVHTVFLDAQGGTAAATLKLTLQATGQTVTFLDAYPLSNDEPFTFPKPINMTPGDTLSLSAATSNIVALVSAFQSGGAGAAASFNIRGAYDNTFTYSKLDVVTLGGTSFVAVNDDVSGSTPPSVNWVVLAAKGETGESAFTAGDGLTLTGDVFAIDGTVATLTGTQTLTSKTIAFGSNTLTDVASTNTAQSLTSKTLATTLFDNNNREKTTVQASAATGTITFDVLTQQVLFYTSNATANFTINIRGNGSTTLDSLMAVGDAITLAFFNTNGGTAYFNNVVQVDGSAVTPKWQGGTTPDAGNASSVDIYTYTVIKTGAATFSVFASQTQFA
jgi:hypothetical protein